MQVTRHRNAASHWGCSLLGRAGLWSKKWKGGGESPGQTKERDWKCCWAEAEENALRVYALPCSEGPFPGGRDLPSGAEWYLWPAQHVCLASLCWGWGSWKSSCFPFNISAYSCHASLVTKQKSPPYLAVVSIKDDLRLCTRCPSLYASNSAGSLWWQTRQGTNANQKWEDKGLMTACHAMGTDMNYEIMAVKTKIPAGARSVYWITCQRLWRSWSESYAEGEVL